MANERAWNVHLLASADSYRAGDTKNLAVTISEEVCPRDANGDLDWGHADWPTDEEIAEEASRLVGVPVLVEFLDKGDSLAEGIYRVEIVG